MTEIPPHNLPKNLETCHELIRQMIAHPILIERPIVVKGNQVRVGRPPESVLEIL